MNGNEEFDWQQWQMTQEAENAKRLEKRLAEQGRSMYLRLEQGENNLTLLKELPTQKMSNWGKEQMVFKVEKNDELYDWAVTITSPMYMKVVNLMTKAPVDVIVVRVGVGQQTRLSLIE